jgi:hypothetical protein
MSALVASSVSVVRGQSFIEPGFESYEVSRGAFVMPASGAWVFANDASVVEPFATNRDNGLFGDCSALFAPVEGQHYASAHGGSCHYSRSIPAGSM